MWAWRLQQCNHFWSCGRAFLVITVSNLSCFGRNLKYMCGTTAHGYQKNLSVAQRGRMASKPVLFYFFLREQCMWYFSYLFCSVYLKKTTDVNQWNREKIWNFLQWCFKAPKCQTLGYAIVRSMQLKWHNFG